MEHSCKTCNEPTRGYKCDECGAEFDLFDENHECGGDHLQPKCSGCGQVESECICGE